MFFVVCKLVSVEEFGDRFVVEVLILQRKVENLRLAHAHTFSMGYASNS